MRQYTIQCDIPFDRDIVIECEVPVNKKYFDIRLVKYPPILNIVGVGSITVQCRNYIEGSKNVPLSDFIKGLVGSQDIPPTLYVEDIVECINKQVHYTLERLIKNDML